MKASWIVLIAVLVPVLCAQCHSEEKGKFAKFSTLVIFSQQELDLPIPASRVQKHYDASYRQDWKAILATLEQMLTSIETSRVQCPLPPDAFTHIRNEVITKSEHVTNNIARLDPTGTQSGLYVPVRRFVRHVRTVLPDALELVCTQPQILHNRIQAARRDLNRMQKYLSSEITTVD